MSNHSDRDIWHSFKTGDQKAVSFIYRQYYPALYHYGLQFTPHIPLVEDTIQDLFADLIKNKKSIGDTDNILFYLLKSFRRRLIRRLDHSHRFNVPGVMTDEPPFAVARSVEQDIIRDEEEKQRATILLKALATLTPRQREAIYLRYTRELDYITIAGIMHISTEACRNLVARAISHLRQAVAK